MGKPAYPKSTRKTSRKSGVRDAGLAPVDALFTAGQQRVIGLLFGRPAETHSVSEIIAATGTGSGAAQRELARLVESRLVTVQPVGNQKRYQANPYAPLYKELIGIVRKTVTIAGRKPSSRAYIGARTGSKQT